MSDLSDEHGPAMWVHQRGERTPTLIGHVVRDADLYWCPSDSCLIVVEEPSIEYMSVKLYKLIDGKAQPVPNVDKRIWDGVRRAAGEGAEVLFTGAEVIAWPGEKHVLIVAQGRYLRKGTSTEGGIVTLGYLMDLSTGRISSRVPADELKTKYYFTKRIV